MKKTLSIILALIMMLSTLALVACDNNDDNNGDNTTTNASDVLDGPENTGNTETTGATETTTPETEANKSAYESATDLYNKVWAAYGEDNKFPCAGGDVAHENMEGPGAYTFENIYDAGELIFSADDLAVSFKSMSLLTDELFDMIDSTDVASLMHMMNRNTFCSVVVKLKDASKANDFAEAYKTAVQGQRWMCGFPDKVVVISVDNYLVLAYGHEGNINNLSAACSAVDSSTKVLVDAPAEA